jgi:hypothetical protein
MLDASTATGLPVGAKRWNETNKRFEKYNGSSWEALIPEATTSVPGLMSTGDKTKVDALKTGSSTDKQTNAYDGTAGSLLVNGAFGLAGSTAPTSLSAAGALDAIDKTSVYSVSGTNCQTVGGPSGGSAGVVLTIAYSGSYGAQYYLSVNAPHPKLWYRQKNSGTWSEWVEVLHTGNISNTHIPVDSTHRWATDAEKANWNGAYTHSNQAHAPSNAQKNSDITKAEIEAKLTGRLTSHYHRTVTISTTEASGGEGGDVWFRV